MTSSTLSVTGLAVAPSRRAHELTVYLEEMWAYVPEDALDDNFDDAHVAAECLFQCEIHGRQPVGYQV